MNYTSFIIKILNKPHYTLYEQKIPFTINHLVLTKAMVNIGNISCSKANSRPKTPIFVPSTFFETYSFTKFYLR